MSYFFKNACVAKITAEGCKALDDFSKLQDALEHNRLQDVPADQMQSSGFVPVLDDEPGRPLVHVVQTDTAAICFGGQRRILPAAVVNEVLKQRLAQMLDTDGVMPRGKARRRLKDDIVAELLPRAFVSPSRSMATLERQHGWFICSSSSLKASENIISAVRSALGSLPTVPLAADGARRRLTRWVADPSTLPEGLALGEACTLEDADGASVRCKHCDLAAQDIQQHLQAGKQVVRLDVVWRERLAFALAEDLTLRGIRFLDLATDGMGETEDKASEIDACLTLQALEFTELLKNLCQWFDLEF